MTIITTFVLAVIFWIPASIAMDAQRERRLREAMEQHPVFAFLFLLFNIFLASKGYATPKDSRITKCWLRLLSILQSKASHEDMLDALEERYFIQVVTTGYAAAQKWRRDQIWNSLKPLLQQKVYSCFRWIAKTVLPIVLRTLADHFLKRIGF
ncbi:hypothetical protein [Capsulimonas corticalis]|uniref:hypothetical protein n=1 Tax=Capsulimonas corticalis TaxID=2219043 RepID=UPI0014034E98|nr:hypothetical protein [Capsulimonas corticalis]